MKQSPKRFFGRPIGNTEREERQNRDSPICVTAHYVRACLSPDFFAVHASTLLMITLSEKDKTL